MTKRQFGILASLQVAILASVIGVGAVLIQRLDSPGSAVDLAVIRGAVSSSLIMKGTYPRSLYDVASDAAAAAAAAEHAAGEAASSAGDAAKAANDILDMTYEAASSAGDAAKAANDILDMTYIICDKLNC